MHNVLKSSARAAIICCMWVFGIGSVSANLDCGSIDPEQPCSGTKVTHDVDGVTFAYEFHCDGGPCFGGRFLDGSPWIAHPNGGQITFTAATPNSASGGFEKNPGTYRGYLDQPYVREQGLLSCVGENRSGTVDSSYARALDLSQSFPFQAPPDNGVYVRVKSYDGGDCNYTRSVGSCCVDAYSAITVLDGLPVDGVNGTRMFRPGAAGDDKDMFTLDDFDFSRLPAIAGLSEYGSPTDTRWMRPYPNYFLGGNGDQGRRWTPRSRGFQNYSIDRANQFLRALAGVMGTEPLSGDKLQSVRGMVQYGVELYAGYKENIHWSGGAGQYQGQWLPIVFAAALTTRPSLEDDVKRIPGSMETDAIRNQFIELYQIRENVNGVPIWGSFPGRQASAGDGCRQGGFSGTGRYWSDYTHNILRGQSGYQKGTCGDPYGYIDGPAELPGRTYASCCSSGPYVGMAAVLALWPRLAEVANNPTFVNFAKRLMDGDQWADQGGWWAEGDDECAKFDPRESSSCNPWTSSNTCNYFGITWGAKPTNHYECVTVSEAAAAGHPDPVSRWSGENRHMRGSPGDSLGRADPGVALWAFLSEYDVSSVGTPPAAPQLFLD